VKKPDLVSAMAESADITKAQADLALSIILQNVRDALTKGEVVQLGDLGRLVVTDRPARAGRNPQTGESITIAASRAIHFKPSAPLKRAVNGGKD
jgi:DNA-binding protein HU-beta